MDLIYCAGANKELDRIALEEGFLLGVRSDRKSYYPVQFVDIDYKAPDFERHLQRVAQERPKYATVTDLSEKETSLPDIDRALSQAHRLKEYCEVPLIIPKLLDQIALITKEIAIGFSIPTKYGGVGFSLWEAHNVLTGYRVHLLGGSPADQLEYHRALTAMGNTVISVDGNSAKKAAIYGDYWNGYKWERNPNQDKGHYAESWRLSCQGIKRMWQYANSL